MLTPVKASGWFNTSLSDEERASLIESGIIVVNDKFFDLWERVASIWLLRGGRGGGKSEAVFDRLLDKSLTDKYFRGYYGRKVFDTVRGSCFKTLDECIKKQRLQKWFNYSNADHSTMIITAKGTGHQFVPFGSDKPDKIKSIKDPTHIVCEEFNQFDFEDFQEIFPTLRTERAETEFYGMFNTKDVFPHDWIPRVFFPEIADKQVNIDIFEGVDIQNIFVNYYDNYFIDHEEYRKKLMISAGGNVTLFNAIANGAWGMRENEDPWLYAFDQDKHVKPLRFNPTFPVYLSFDFNRDPMSCTAWQMSPSLGINGSFLHCIAEFTDIQGLEKMCSKIRSRFANSILFVTGDSNGNSKYHAHVLQYNDSDESTYQGKNDTNYRIIQRALNLNEKQMHTFSKNMEHGDSRQLCNIMFNSYPNLFIDPSCKLLIAECQIATVDPKSSKPSQILKDRGTYKMDIFDTMRYIMQRYFKKYTDLVLPKRA